MTRASYFSKSEGLQREIRMRNYTTGDVPADTETSGEDTDQCEVVAVDFPDQGGLFIRPLLYMHHLSIDDINNRLQEAKENNGDMSDIWKKHYFKNGKAFKQMFPTGNGKHSSLLVFNTTFHLQSHCLHEPIFAFTWFGAIKDI